MKYLKSYKLFEAFHIPEIIKDLTSHLYDDIKSRLDEDIIEIIVGKEFYFGVRKIYFHLNDSENNSFLPTQSNLRKVIINLDRDFSESTLCHELLHAYQFIKTRKNRGHQRTAIQREEKEMPFEIKSLIHLFYYSSQDELDAYITSFYYGDESDDYLLIMKLMKSFSGKKWFNLIKDTKPFKISIFDEYSLPDELPQYIYGIFFISSGFNPSGSFKKIKNMNLEQFLMWCESYFRKIADKQLRRIYRIKSQQ